MRRVLWKQMLRRYEDVVPIASWMKPDPDGSYTRLKNTMSIEFHDSIARAWELYHDTDIKSYKVTAEWRQTLWDWGVWYIKTIDSTYDPFTWEHTKSTKQTHYDPTTLQMITII